MSKNRPGRWDSQLSWCFVKARSIGGLRPFVMSQFLDEGPCAIYSNPQRWLDALLDFAGRVQYADPVSEMRAGFHLSRQKGLFPTQRKTN
jgi:hypothetical protein